MPLDEVFVGVSEDQAKVSFESGEIWCSRGVSRVSNSLNLQLWQMSDLEIDIAANTSASKASVVLHEALQDLELEEKFDVFHFFGALPKELRELIWKCSLPEPRIIEVILDHGYWRVAKMTYNAVEHKVFMSGGQVSYNLGK